MGILSLFVLVTWYIMNIEPAMSLVYESPANDFKESITMFAKKSFKAIAEGRTGNYIYSPAGASIALTMAAFAARGRTALETRELLRLPTDDGQTIDEITAILNNLKRINGNETHITSKMFTPALSKVKKEFVDMTQSIFNSRTRAVDYEDSFDARRVINNWFWFQTNSRIKEILDPVFIARDTQLLLLTAGYVETRWRKPFPSSQTMPRPFHVNGKEVRNVQTMLVSGYFPFGEIYGVDATFLELPFANPSAGDALSMYIILPNSKNGLSDLIENFDKISMLTLLSATSRSMNVYLPKLNFESTLSLQWPLFHLGFWDMFLPFSNFSGITEERRLRVSSVIQKVHIKVDENDNPAAALPSIVGFESRDSDLLPDFRVDHPFVCVIMKMDGIPLFVTVVNEPEYGVSNELPLMERGYHSM